MADWIWAHDLVKKLAEDNPQRPDYRIELATAKYNVARVPVSRTQGSNFSDDVVALEKNYRDALADQDRLVAECPGIGDNHQRRAATLDSAATWINDSLDYEQFAEHRKARDADALNFHRRSQAIWQKLTREHPTVLSYWRGLAVSQQRLGIVLERLGKLDEAEQ